jgi:predicted ATPase/DNA-binding SARP family transcriptional activator
MLGVRLLGELTVESSGRPIALSGSWRARSLLAWLALNPGGHQRADIAARFWPDVLDSSARASLRNALWAIRRSLGAEADAALLATRERVGLRGPPAVWVDATAFEEETRRGRLEDALALCRGELLADLDDEWVFEYRDAHRERLALLFERLAAAAGAGGEHREAIRWTRKRVALEPLAEDAHRALLARMLAAGDRAGALTAAARLQDRLRRELGISLSEETHELVLRIRAGTDVRRDVELDVDVEEREPRTTARHNLPIALTSFVGRERELRDVAGLLDRDRLVTLTGAGGSGKTRLALEAARRRVDTCRDGVWLVELAGLDDPTLLPASIASALGLTLPSRRSPVDGLGSHLDRWRTLLILDNCEHLVAACAVLAAHLLGHCRDVRILATSREPLRVPGEVIWRVPSLRLPAPGRSRPAELADYESTQLFCERAAAAAPGFALHEGNADAVAEICVRLDGMPLALEFAAARVGALSPAEIAERLGDCLAVLTAGSRSALDRQQTLRATLSWSHELLTGMERTLFRRLAVFAGGFGLAAVEEVAAGDGVERREVADLLGRLVDKSLVVADDDRDGYRYRLLEPVRQYARERLREAAESTTLQARHLAFFLEVARTLDPEAADAGRSVAPARLEADHDNLRAALGWAVSREPEDALRLAVHVWPMWMARSHFQEGSRWLRAALAAAPAPTALRAEALRAACGLELRLGRTAALSELGTERVAIIRGLGDRGAVAHALDEVGTYEYMAGRYDRAERLYAESRALAEELDDPRVAAAVLHSEAVLAQCRGEFVEAHDALLDSLSRLRTLPVRDGQPFFRVHTVGLFVATEEPARAPRMYFEETVQFFRRADARRAIGYVLAGLGDVARAQGRRPVARERLTESLEHFREAHDEMGTAFALNRLGSLAGASGEHELGHASLQEALSLRRRLGDRRAIGMTLGNLGVLAAREGDLERGRAIIGEALALFEQTDDAPAQMGMRLNLGNLAANVGEYRRARDLLAESRQMAEAQRLFRCAGWATLTLADVAIADGDAELATGLLDAAIGRLRSLGDRWGVSFGLELERRAHVSPPSA